MIKESKTFELIKSGDSVLINKGLRIVYTQCFPLVEKYVIKNSGSIDEAKDIFQEGVSVFYDNIMNDKFEGKSSVKTYLFSICKNLWLLRLRKNKLQITDIEEINEQNIEHLESQTINDKKMTEVMSALKDDCQQILKYFYYNKKSMVEISQLLGFKNEQVARVKKMRCMKYLMQIVFNKGLVYEDFIV